MRRLERLDDLFLTHFLCPCFDHHDGVVAAGHDEIELTLLTLLEGRIDDELTVHDADADARNRLLEWNVGEGQGRRGAGDRQHVGVVLLIGREDEGNDLGLVTPARREERADRPIDDTTRQHLLFGRLAFTFEEPAGNAS